MAVEIATCDHRRNAKSLGASSESPNEKRADMPVRRNKRKLSEPRKRTDFSMKRFCPESPPGSESDSGCSDVFDVKENPPDTPSPDISSGQGGDDSSQGVSERGDTPRSYPCMNKGHFLVPNLYFPHPIVGHPPGTVPHPNRQVKFQNPDTVSTPQFGNYIQTGGPVSVDLEDYSEHDFSGKKMRKNYKNMTRERRVEANARERSRVHTISAAFDSLRRAVPSYSYNQKLSKLAILRIACSYIMALGSLAEEDYNGDKCKHSFAESVDMCTRTIQTEGRARRRH